MLPLLARHMCVANTRQKATRKQVALNTALLESTSFVANMKTPAADVNNTLRGVIELDDAAKARCKAMGTPHTWDEINSFYSNDEYHAYMVAKIDKRRTSGPENTRDCLNLLGGARTIHRYTNAKSTGNPQEYPEVFKTFLVERHVQGQSKKLPIAKRKEIARKEIPLTVKNLRNNNRDETVESILVS